MKLVYFTVSNYCKVIALIAIATLSDSTLAESLGAQALCRDARKIAVVYLRRHGYPPCEVRDSSKANPIYSTKDKVGACVLQFDEYVTVKLRQDKLSCGYSAKLDNSGLDNLKKSNAQLINANKRLTAENKKLVSNLASVQSQKSRQHFEAVDVDKAITQNPLIDVKITDDGSDEAGLISDFVSWKVPSNPTARSVHKEWLGKLSNYHSNVIRYFFSPSAIELMDKESREKCKNSSYCRQLYVAFMLSEVVNLK